MILHFLLYIIYIYTHYRFMEEFELTMEDFGSEEWMRESVPGSADPSYRNTYGRTRSN